MTYGPDGKRLSLTDSSGTRKFFYDGEDVIQEYDSDWSTVNKEYTHGPWVDEPLSMTEHSAGQPSSTYYLMKDRLGSIISILDENEALKTTYSYDAFGEPTATYHSGQVGCAYRFTGREYDAGMGNYASMVSAEAQPRPKARERRLSARFFSRDPIFSLQSLYAYCNNSPVNFTDPSGCWYAIPWWIPVCTEGDEDEDEDKEDEKDDNDAADQPPQYQEADLNGDGVVTWEEYYDWVSADPTHAYDVTESAGEGGTGSATDGVGDTGSATEATVATDFNWSYYAGWDDFDASNANIRTIAPR